MQRVIARICEVAKFMELSNLFLLNHTMKVTEKQISIAALNALTILKNNMTNNSQPSLSQRIAEFQETYRGDFYYSDSERNAYRAAEAFHAGVNSAKIIIKELEAIIESQTSNMLLAQHQIVCGEAEAGQKTLFSSIEKTKQLKGE